MRAKSISRSKALKKADDAFSLFIRKRDKFKCVLCGATKENATITAGHIIKRGKWNTRYDPMNVHALCSVCNFRDFRDSAYHDKYVAWFVKKFGGYEWIDMQARSEAMRQYKKQELLELAEQYSGRTG